MGRKSNETLLREYVDHLRRERGRSPETVYRYKLTVETLIDLTGAHVCDLSTDQLRGYVLAPTIKGRRGAGAEPADATKKRRVAELRTFYSWLHAEGYIAHNPALRLVAPTVHNENPKPFPSDVWRDLWCSDLSDSDRVGFGLAMFCGLRRHEVTLLTARHFVDAPKPIIAGFKRKGGHKRNIAWLSCVLWFGQHRPELIGGDSHTFIEPLSRLRSTRADAPALLDWDDVKGPVCGCQKYERPEGHIDPQTFGRRLRRALDAAGLPPDAGTPHQLRHAFCTALLGGGVPLLDVSRLAGHASVTMTQRYIATSEDPLAGLLVDESQVSAHVIVNRFGEGTR